ncbi:RagB/SusD family nutrient uptake outer membrane protein [Mangrovivirga sp. M17]|uniref:RagB/SusD family nutrient uptake outer membrane protein n=1 Tax=Mangrovivirga halotolerans TaxID=2993936 RepID=A0ABT3RTQ9_9BACT|nr:RagB/SusD family nutrient uptake outer membrane protein [Mangrovivirga halotolerans]MCX2745174.1 RagB/SusD family nutrient uptake outer membrane protein [Mangrovivirga halotolerans]
MKRIYIFLFSILFVFACEIDEVVDPNNPSLASVLDNASKAELQVLITGLETRSRGYYENATEMFGTFGREVYPYFGSDPRFQNEWLGLEITETYNDFFASGDSYILPYLAVKQANILIQSVENTEALTAEEAAGYTGFAKTIKGHQLLYPLMQQYQNGIRIDVEDKLNPGPILPYDEALAEIRNILDDGLQDLQAAGSSFDFQLTSGYLGFDSPAGMIEVNRAIAARAALYAEDYSGALTALEDSFMDMDTSFNIGPAHVFGNPPDVSNPLFYPLNAATSTILIVHPALIEDALPGDQRVVNKFFQRDDPVINNNISDDNGDAIPGEYQDARWPSNTTNITYIRNEELILIYAEASVWEGNTQDAIDAINLIRNTWGIADYSGGTSNDELIDEILFQRRYSLWAEAGHRWIDLRRTDRLNDTYVDLRSGGNIFTQVARRVSEINWEQNQ